MLLEMILCNDSLVITIENPFHFDTHSIMREINKFAASKKISLNDVDIIGLIPKLIRGIAGCESGCPANAKSLVEQGYKNFVLKYIEGGILSAQIGLSSGGVLQLKAFPDF